MKKFVIATSILFGIVNSAQAIPIIDNQNTGTKLEFSGSLRLQWCSESQRINHYQTNSTEHEHSNGPLRNNDSRFGFRLTQQLSDNYYLIGRATWRFRGTGNSNHDFTDIYSRQLYAGIGHKDYGELTYGNQVLITDEIKQTDLANTLSLSDGLLNYAARRSIQYVYKGIEGLKIGTYYGSASPRDNRGENLINPRKDIWGVGAIYHYEFNHQNHIKLATGFSKERFNIHHSNRNYAVTAYAFDTAYTWDKTTFGIDLERRITTDRYEVGDKRTEQQLRTIIYHRLTNNWNAYVMYAYKTNKLNAVMANDTNNKTHQFMLGSEYYLVPEYVKAFVEWQTNKSKEQINSETISKQRDYITVIGLRVYF